MNHLQIFNVAPYMPPALEFLETLSRNMWWCWNLDAVDLFRRIDTGLWKTVGRNPMKLLSRVSQERLDELQRDEGFLGHLSDVKRRFERDVTTERQQVAKSDRHQRIAYFSLEYAIHEMLRVYSGGLGVLAGDHLKSASDLKIPLVAVGLLYRKGYFTQLLDEHGWQRELYPENELEYLPVRRATDPDGQSVRVSVPIPGGRIAADVWELDVGRIPLYLLDTNVRDNPLELRAVTGQLYSGDREMRLRQELILGIGGFRALVAMGYDPAVCHINEGHSAFLSLGRIEYLMQKRALDLATAREVVSRSTVFTTHTPVPAGNEWFDVNFVRPYIEALSREMPIIPDQVIADGQPSGEHTSHELSMTIYGLRMAKFTNGVSELHGEVSRKMWAHLWPGRPVDEVPIRHVTNGIHVPSWISPEIMSLYFRHMGSIWNKFPLSEGFVSNVMSLPDEDLWRAREHARARLIRFVREALRKQLLRQRASRAEVEGAETIFDKDALTIGFARRFATYKRAVLILRNRERLEAILADDKRPVQFVFAGKAHPADEYGKRFIQEIVAFSKTQGARGRVVFLENYNMGLARILVQGVDVWLNTPRKPREASGTSGMKAAANGVLHFSILDGWWHEGYSPDCGWAIGDTTQYDNEEEEDNADSQSLFSVLEDQIIPEFYDRNPSRGLSKVWTTKMKASIAMSLSMFSSHRMVSEYFQKAYEPAARNYDQLLAGDAALARRYSDKRRKLTSSWQRIEIDEPVVSREVSSMHVGDTFTVTVRVRLGELSPADVDVQIYYGPVDSENVSRASFAESMSYAGESDGSHIFQHELHCEKTGRFGFTARVVPSSAEWRDEIPGFLTWAKGPVAKNE